MSWDGPRQQHAISPVHGWLKASRMDPTIGFFWCLITIHVIFWTILSTLTQPNLPAETLEMLSSGRAFAWGYATHPPLGVWLAAAMSSIAAPANWPVYLLAQMCSMVSVWAAWKLGREFLHPWTALCAAFVLLGGYSCTISASAFSGDHLAAAMWSLSIYMFHRALTHDRRRYWAATGIFLALGFLSSYSTLLLLVTMFVFTLVDDRARRCWDSSWPFLAGMAMAACLMPHILWLTQNQFLTIQTGIERSASVTHHLVQPLSYLGTQLLCVIPVVVLLAPLIAWFSLEEPAKSKGEDAEERDFARHYLLWMTCLPPAIIFSLSLIAGPSSGLFAGVTNWSYLGVVMLLWGHLNETRPSWRRSIVRIGSAAGLFAAALIAITLMVPQIRKTGTTTQFPGVALARQIEKAWHNAGYTGKTPVVAGPSHLVRNATWYADRSFSMKSYADLDPELNPNINDQTMVRQGGIIVWDANDPNAPSSEELTQRFGQVSIAPAIDLPWQTQAKLPAVRLGMAIVHPASAIQTAETTRPASTQTVSHEIPDYLTSDGRVIQAESQQPQAQLQSQVPSPARPQTQSELEPTPAARTMQFRGLSIAPAPADSPAATRTYLGPPGELRSFPPNGSTIPASARSTLVTPKTEETPVPELPPAAPEQTEESAESAKEALSFPALPDTQPVQQPDWKVQ